MKKKLMISVLMIFILSFFVFSYTLAQNEEGETKTDSIAQEDTSAAVVAPEEVVEDSGISGFESFARQIVGSGLVDLFIQGGWVMWPMLILVIWAVATIIWRMVALRYAKINVHSFLEKIVPLVEEDNIEEAEEICAKTRGPVANIMHSGLLKADQGVEAVEKAMEGVGTLEMSFLEKGLIALATTINLAPMLGFLGTVVGMIQAFEAIAAAGEVEPTIVASGISVALVTTASGLAVAIPIQLFNNIFVSMIDSMIIDMQKGSEKLVETLMVK